MGVWWEGGRGERHYSTPVVNSRSAYMQFLRITFCNFNRADCGECMIAALHMHAGVSTSGMSKLVHKHHYFRPMAEVHCAAENGGGLGTRLTSGHLPISSPLRFLLF